MIVNGINVTMWRRNKFQTPVLTFKNNVHRLSWRNVKDITNLAVSRRQSFVNIFIALKNKQCFKSHLISIKLESSFLGQITHHFKFKNLLRD